MEPIYIDGETQPPKNKRLILSTHQHGIEYSVLGYYDGSQYTNLNGDKIAGRIYAYILFPEPAVYLGSIND